uniref:Uncharacterized protein n=1 Tax=Arundo donax TaxID=35708 RepID=A0A0A9I3A1_ARUDO
MGGQPAQHDAHQREIGPWKRMICFARLWRLTKEKIGKR